MSKLKSEYIKLTNIETIPSDFNQEVLSTIEIQLLKRFDFNFGIKPFTRLPQF